MKFVFKYPQENSRIKISDSNRWIFNLCVDFYRNELFQETLGYSFHFLAHAARRCTFTFRIRHHITNIISCMSLFWLRSRKKSACTYCVELPDGAHGAPMNNLFSFLPCCGDLSNLARRKSLLLCSECEVLKHLGVT